MDFDVTFLAPCWPWQIAYHVLFLQSKGLPKKCRSSPFKNPLLWVVWKSNGHCCFCSLMTTLVCCWLSSPSFVFSHLFVPLWQHCYAFFLSFLVFLLVNITAMDFLVIFSSFCTQTALLWIFSSFLVFLLTHITAMEFLIFFLSFSSPMTLLSLAS